MVFQVKTVSGCPALIYLLAGLATAPTSHENGAAGGGPADVPIPDINCDLVSRNDKDNERYQ